MNLPAKIGNNCFPNLEFIQIRIPPGLPHPSPKFM
jgi:hypothetical protein